MREIKAPNKFKDKIYVFLAGSIEMGKAENWQEKVARELKGFDNIVLLNPRRDDWDSDWKQEIKNKQFRGQVEWELEAQEKADYIILYLDPNTKSPISLLELGLFKDKKMFVCCPSGFYRKGNVDIVCKRYLGNVPYENLDDLLHNFKEVLNILKEYK